MRLPSSLIRSHASWSELPDAAAHSAREGSPLLLEHSGRTKKGQEKKTNQDHIAIVRVWNDTERDGTLMILADGLGGHRGGEVASLMLTETLPMLLQNRHGNNVLTDLVESVIEIHELIQQKADQEKNLRGMCSTAVVCLMVNRILYIVHVGDSRGYLFREGQLVFRTRDHSLKESSTVRQSTRKLDHVLTQSVGVGSPLIPGIAIYELEPGDRIVMCSDGVSDVVTEEEMSYMVDGAKPENASRNLLELAAAKGSVDDLSVIIASVTAQKGQ